MNKNDDFILNVKGIVKNFSGVKALDGVDFEVGKGEIVALVGENGAGKSTLMKTLARVHKEDEGEIFFMGEKADFENPLEAKNKGLVLIFQELSLVNEMTVCENIFLGSLTPKGKIKINWKELKTKARKVLDELECSFSEDELVGNLSISQQQMVEIGRGIAFGAKLIIFDEPTSSLTDTEKNVLFKVIRKLKDNGAGIIYISHKMDEVFDLTDRIIVFRDGKRTGTLKTKETNLKEVTGFMIGRDLNDFFKKNNGQKGDSILKVEGLTSEGSFSDVSFEVAQGEVLGLYGLVGAGRTEIAEAIFGVRKYQKGKIYFEGKEVKIRNSLDSTKLGIGLVPEDRKLQGCILNMCCKDNMSLAHLSGLSNYGFIASKQENELYEKYRKAFSIKSPSPKQMIGKLSGGNQQKIILGKWLAISPKLLILDEPTRGIDVGSKAEIHDLISDMAEQGMAVIVISSEMPEIIGICNRVITIHHGQVTKEFHDKDKITEAKLISGLHIS